jgi:hypothetical protein
MSLPITTESPLEYHPPTHPTPGLPATKRMYLTRLYYQLGEWLDYYTGDHTLSSRLRRLKSLSMEATSTLEPTKAREVIEEKNIRLFPQFGVAGHWPPVLFLHGSEDTQVPIQESEHLAENLKAVGVENELIVVKRIRLTTLQTQRSLGSCLTGPQRFSSEISKSRPTRRLSWRIGALRDCPLGLPGREIFAKILHLDASILHTYEHILPVKIVRDECNPREKQSSHFDWTEVRGDRCDVCPRSGVEVKFFLVKAEEGRDYARSGCHIHS